MLPESDVVYLLDREGIAPYDDELCCEPEPLAEFVIVDADAPMVEELRAWLRGLLYGLKS